MKGKIIALFCGLAVIVFCLEIGLWLLGYLHQRQYDFRTKSRDKRTANSGFTVLCLGDSFTEGALGCDPRDAYPEQLERLIKSKDKYREALVINRGVGGNNTAMILKDLDSRLAASHPDVVVLLCGGANYWNFLGWDRRKKGGGSHFSLTELLYRVRTFKLAALLSRGRAGGTKQKENKQKDLVREDFFGEENLRERGLAYKQSGRYAEAIRCFEEGIRLMPEDGGNYHELGGIYHILGRTDKAVSVFLQGIEAAPADSSNYAGLGRLCLEKGQTQEAIVRFKESIEKNPRATLSYTGLGAAFKNAGRLDEAVHWFEKAVELAPGYPENYIGLAGVLLEKEEYEQAALWFSKALILDSKNPAIFRGLYRAYNRSGIKQHKTGGHKKGLTVLLDKPRSPEDFFSIGVMFRVRAREEEALRWFRKGIRKFPGDGLNYLGELLIYKNRGEDDKARMSLNTLRHMEFIGPEMSRETVVEFFNICSRLNSDQEMAGLLQEMSARNPFLARYADLIDDKKDKKRLIREWIEADITEIIRICRENGISIILLNYPENKEIAGLLGMIAWKQDVPLVDNYRTFSRLWQKRERRSDYLIHDGHCKAKGNGVIARNILDTLIKQKLIEWE